MVLYHTRVKRVLQNHFALNISIIDLFSPTSENEALLLCSKLFIGRSREDKRERLEELSSLPHLSEIQIRGFTRHHSC